MTTHFDQFFPFARPNINQAAIDEVSDCLRSGWITTGPRCQAFEKALEQYLHAARVLLLSSGTAALHLSLLALDFKPGDEVITTPMTFAATLNTIIIAGAKPVLVDVNLHDYNISVDRLSAAITANTRAILPVHLCGLAADLDPIYDLAQQHHLRVIEDAAQAIGSEYKGKRIGSFGDTQIFSFHPNKNITTGEGGCVTTRDETLAKQVSLLRFHGIDREAWDRFGKTGSQHYDVVCAGLKYNMMDIQAALGIHQLKQLDHFIAQRTHLAQRYYQQLKDCAALTLPQTPHYEHRHSWHLFAPLINPEIAGINRDQFMAEMKARNIGTGLHYQAAHRYSYYQKKLGVKEGDFPHAETIGDRIVSLPLFPGMTEAEQDAIIATIKSIFDEYKR